MPDGVKNTVATLAKALDVKSYGEAKRQDRVGDNLEHDHIPSFAALVAAKEKTLGRRLTSQELKSLKAESTIVTIPKEVHQKSRT